MKKLFILIIPTLFFACAIHDTSNNPTNNQKIGIVTPTSSLYPATDFSNQLPSTAIPVIQKTPSAFSAAEEKLNEFKSTSTATPFPTIKPGTILSTSSITPEPGHLAYITHDSIVVINSDGTGRRIIPFPDDPIYFYISPNGEWVAYEGCESYDFDNNECLGSDSIHAIHLPDGEFITIISISDKEKETDVFYAGNMIWSQDNRIFAFSAETDGPSHDLYSFDTEKLLLHRFTSDNADTWVDAISPDSQWILYSDCRQVFEYGEEKEFWPWECTLNKISPFNKTNKGAISLAQYKRDAFSPGSVFSKWIDNSRFLYSSPCQDDCTCHGLYKYQLDTGERRKIVNDEFRQCGDMYLFWEMENVDNKILIHIDDSQGDLEQGWNIINVFGKVFSSNVDIDVYSIKAIFTRPSQYNRFVMLSEEGVYGVSADGEMHEISKLTDARFRQSANGYFVLFTDSELEIYDNNDQLIDAINGLTFGEVQLNPTKPEIYISASIDSMTWGIFFWSLSGKGLSLVYQCNITQPECDAHIVPDSGKVYDFYEPSELLWLP